MDSAFAWLNAIFNYFGQFIPRPYLVKWTERAVRYRRGNYPVEVAPGIRWYFPLTTHVESAEVVWSVQEFKPTTLTTLDGHTMSVGFTMMYRITDIVQTHVSTDNFIDSLSELAELPLADIWHSNNRARLREMAALQPGARRSELDRLLTKRARATCSFLGVQIRYCRVNFDANARVLKLLHEDFT